MSERWIKIRNNLPGDPRTSRICDLCDCEIPTAVGALVIFFIHADEHTANGHMPGLSLKGIDRLTGLQGLGDALADIGWIEPQEDGIHISRFAEHNGSSAKRRAKEAKRKAETRKTSASHPEPDGKSSASDADKTKTKTGRDAGLEHSSLSLSTSQDGKEGSGEENPSPDPLDIYGLYAAASAKHSHQREALIAIRASIDRGEWLETIDERTRLIAEQLKRWPAKDRPFIPSPATFFENERWRDDPKAWAPKADGKTPGTLPHRGKVKQFRPDPSTAIDTEF